MASWYHLCSGTSRKAPLTVCMHTKRCIGRIPSYPTKKSFGQQLWNVFKQSGYILTPTGYSLKASLYFTCFLHSLNKYKFILSYNSIKSKPNLNYLTRIWQENIFSPASLTPFAKTSLSERYTKTLSGISFCTSR